jgi:release factor glutamine methyltransferase
MWPRRQGHFLGGRASRGEALIAAPDVGTTVAVALRDAALLLGTASDSPRLDAELLMAHALGVAREEVLLRRMRDSAPQTFTPLIARRLGHEPVAYIIGFQEFYGLEFEVSRAVLIPRADSETLVAAALAARPDARRVLDCGTGSGALLLAVLAHLPAATGVGIDRSDASLAVARRNAARFGLADRARMLRVDWDQSDWRATFDTRFDLILANPPYVEEDAALSASVRDFEPAGALFAGPEGLDAYRRLIPQLASLIAPDGRAMIEIGATQTPNVTAIAEQADWHVQLHRDLGGRPRVLELSLPG